MKTLASQPAFGGLIDAILDDQADLSAVDRFSLFHADHSPATVPSRVYSALMPARAPRPGEQYAFEVDLDRCSGCKACVVACHSMNGLDDGEVWREVGLLVGGPAARADLPILQHVTSACHHCVDPACLNACPVDAYEKDPVTGIVKHLDDQCFGCQYCTLACPYDAPKFHAAKGIVRKCDMCSDRLAVGEAPACVQGCPHEAIRIRLVEVAEVVALADAKIFLPTAPDPGYTLPTTRYISKHPLRGPVRAADHYYNEPEHAHWPLVVMLVLTQASAGGFAIDAVSRARGLYVPFTLPALSLALGLIGIHASLLHLGRPLYAYRALIGIRHSWLSREIAAFGAFGALTSTYLAALFLRPALAPWLSLAAALSGVAAVLCSVMVYHVVRRPFWHASLSLPKFFGTLALLGLSVALVASPRSRFIASLLVATTLAKLALEASALTHLRDPRSSPLRRSAELLIKPLAKASIARLILGFLGGVLLPLVVLMTPEPKIQAALALAAFVLAFTGEIAERALFFAAVVRPKMPGGVSS